MKIFILFLITAFVLGACNSEVDSSTVNEITNEAHDIDTIFEVSEPLIAEIAEWDGEYKAYNGNYFTVQYPSNFITHPFEPTDQMDEYDFISTDEATFTSPDGEVEFFVYSPLWGGAPESYLEARENEEITTEKETCDNSIEGWPKIIKWVTYTDKNGAYTRSYVSTKTESTDLVFGIKSINDAAYEKYKEHYLKFKESLEQFADA
jgi:hypothetical protein